MKVDFKYYNEEYYNAVCDFLISISQDNRTHINWNWARWEWMYYHPLFQKSDASKIGLWFSNEKIVGIATYDQYMGEGFFVVKAGFEQLEQEIIKYSINNLKDNNGFGIAVNDDDNHTIRLLESNGFIKSDEDENILEINLTGNPLEYMLEHSFEIKSLNEKTDVFLYNKLLWLGFDHGEEVDASDKAIRERETMLSAMHLNPELSVFIIDKQGDYVSHCCCWYNEKTDYAYVEPVCTIPNERGKGLAKAVVYEALNRCKALGARKAYVISNDDFYKAIGFKQHSHYTFYRHS